jgi:hypothetical protein
VNICERDSKNDKKEEIPRGFNLWNFNVSLVETTYAPTRRYAVVFSAQLKLKKIRTRIELFGQEFDRSTTKKTTPETLCF